MRGGFWQHVLASDMAVPRERPLNELTAELVTMLGSLNPVERDEIAFTVLTAWITDGVYDDLLVSLGDAIANGLTVGLGDAGSDTVFRRSFSALVLAECVRRDNLAHVLPADVVLNWADRALGWYTREQDQRASIPGKGRSHAVAHGAHLVAALAQSRHLHGLHLAVLLDVIAERLLAPATSAWTSGEDDRLAAAALLVIYRDLLESEQLEQWVARLGAGSPPTSGGSPAEGWPSPAARNASQFLRALFVQLAIGAVPADATISLNEPPSCRADVLLALANAIPLSTPWLYPTPTSHDD